MQQSEISRHSREDGNPQKRLDKVSTCLKALKKIMNGQIPQKVLTYAILR